VMKTNEKQRRMGWNRWCGAWVAALLLAGGCEVEPLDAAGAATEPVAVAEDALTDIVQPHVCRSAPLPPHSHVRQDVVASYPNGGFYDLAVYASDGTQFSDYQDWLPTGQARVQDTLSGDFTGDGLADTAIVSVQVESGWKFVSLAVRASTGTRFEARNWYHSNNTGANNSARWLAGDFTGDGLTDVAEVWKEDGKITVSVYRSTGQSFAAPVRWINKTRSWADSDRLLVGYFNDDTLADLMIASKDGTHIRFTYLASSGSSFVSSLWTQIMDVTWRDSTELLAGDFNGDGRSDVAELVDNGGDLDIDVWDSLGYGFANARNWAYRQGGMGAGIKWSSGDYDGDGLTDIFAAWPQDGHNVLTVRRSTGSSFLHEHWRISQGGWSDRTSWCTGRYH
jgi:hypothetical protein